ncbi:MAG: hypothetical protein ACLGIF_10610 [Actinomycetes bacterium]
MRTIGVLHDIGYAHVETGLDALDGAKHLAKQGFSPTVCNLVLHHSASTLEVRRDVAARVGGLLWTQEKVK